VWIALGSVAVLGGVGLGFVGGAKDDASAHLALQERAAGRSVVLTGEFVGVETDPGLPTATGQYTVTIPDEQGGGGAVTVTGDQHWGFPPSSDYAAELDFLVLLDDPPRAIARGPVGSIEAVSDESVRAARDTLDGAQTLWMGAIIAYWVAVVALCAWALSRTVRRHRARARSRGGSSVRPSPGSPLPPPRI
jgi:hypothetical protein